MGILIFLSFFFCVLNLISIFRGISQLIYVGRRKSPLKYQILVFPASLELKHIPQANQVHLPLVMNLDLGTESSRNYGEIHSIG